MGIINGMVTGASDRDAVSTPEYSEFYPIKRGARLTLGGAFVTIPFYTTVPIVYYCTHSILHATSIAIY